MSQMVLIIITIGIALFFAMNIGASGAAATMGPAYGSGAIKNKRLALALVGLGALLGAVLGSEAVIKTIGEGIIPTSHLNVETVFVILAGATLTLFFANMIGIPLSTSEVTIGSIVGVGIAFQALYINSLLFIVSFWIIVPVVAFMIAFVLGKIISFAERKWPQLKGTGKWKGVLAALLIITGFIEAFSAGMNNVANAIGPLVGADMLNQSLAMWLGGICLALGAIFLGGKVIETNGKKITSLSLLQGSAVSGTGGTLVIIASVFGIPVPLTQATTSAIVGVGVAEHGARLWHKQVITKIAKVWVVSPLFSLVISYSLANAIITPNPYVLVLVVSMLVAILGTNSLLRSIKEEQKAQKQMAK